MGKLKKQADNIAVVIEEGEICNNNTYRIMEYSDRLTLEVNNIRIECSDSMLALGMTVQSLQYYETIRK